MSNVSPMPAPSAMTSGRILSLLRTRSSRAFSTLSILPNIGSTAWKRRSRPCFAGAGGRQALLDDPPPIGRVLLEMLDDPLGDDVLHDALDVGIAELRLRLTLELRVGQLDADHRGQALAYVVS